jgi:hypothetical protein
VITIVTDISVLHTLLGQSEFTKSFGAPGPLYAGLGVLALVTLDLFFRMAGVGDDAEEQERLGEGTTRAEERCPVVELESLPEHGLSS